QAGYGTGGTREHWRSLSGMKALFCGLAWRADAVARARCFRRSFPIFSANRISGMRLPLRTVMLTAIAATTAVAFSMQTPAVAAYPEKPITMIVPFAPGGASDVVARIIQPKLSEVLGQNVVVENRPGAGGNIAVDYVIRSEPDGYTVLLSNTGTLAINSYVYKDMTFDPVADLKPVTKFVFVPGVLVANADLPVSTVAEFVDYAKANPGLAFSSPGSAASNRLQMELFALEASLELTHVPYSGGAGPSIAAVVAGHIPVTLTSLSSAQGQIKDGQVKALAVAARERVVTIPDAPTFIESDYPKLVSSSWQGLHVPLGTDD